MREPLAIAMVLLAAACSDEPPKNPPAKPPAPADAALRLEHDFGVIPHGEKREHEFPLDLGGLGEPYVPLRVHLDCSCGHADLRIRKQDGSERFVDNSALPRNLPGPDERLFLHVSIDTTDREAIDLAHTTSRGFVVLQPMADLNGTMRIQWPLQLHFGVECPVVLEPFAAIDFGRVATAQTPELLTALRGDERHAGATFGPVTSSDPAITATLEPRDGKSTLRVRCQPGPLGNHRALLTIATSLPGYSVRLPVTWKVVPDLEATPMAKVSVKALLARAQTDAEAVGQFVLVVDHDERRPAEFAVQRIVAADGRDLSPHFAVTFVPIPNQPRQRRLQVRYTGGLVGMVRGEILLTKGGDAGPFLPIELVVLPAKDA